MQLVLFSWNGQAINDFFWSGTPGYSALFPVGERANLHSTPQYVQRSNEFPMQAGAILPSHTITIQINFKGTVHLQREALKGIFRINDFVPHTLVAQDIADSNRQWYLTGLVKDINQKAVTYAIVTIALYDPIWRPVTSSTQTWTNPASGSTFLVPNVMGNTPARPIIQFTPGGARNGQYVYQRWTPIYNQMNIPLSPYPYDVTQGGINTSTLIADTTVSNNLNGAITNSQTSIPINTPVGGGLPSSGMGMIIDGTNGNEQISWTGNGGGSTLTGVTRGIGGTTAVAHATGLTIDRSKMLANGNDLVFQVDGALVDRWLDGINTTVTKVWINASLAPQQSAQLGAALDNVTNYSTIQLVVQDSSYNFLYALAQAANQVVLIDSEAFTFSAVDLVNYQLLGVSRAAKLTTMAAHSVNAIVHWLDHDCWFLYGNQAATAPMVNDTKKPLRDLHNSTNSQIVQSTFLDATSARPDAWQGEISATYGGQSNIFTGNQNTLANPATEMGLGILDYLSQNIWHAETATVIWTFQHPIGITSISISGSKMSTGAYFPAVAGLQYLGQVLQSYTYQVGGKRRKRGGWATITQSIPTWLSLWNEGQPATPNVWSTFTHNGVALSSAQQLIRIILSGSIPAAANGASYMQCDTVTIALNTSNTPVGTLNAENAALYYLNCQLKNQTTGVSIFMTYTMQVGQTLTIDCDAKTVTNSDGANAIGGFSLDTVRSNWFDFLTGANANTLQFIDVGTGNITITFTWKDRAL